jgi:hypothetical protein
LGAFSQATLKLGSVENAEPGTNIQVPVIVTGLSTSGSGFVWIQVTFTFQENVLTYNSISAPHPSLPLTQWIAGSQPGRAAANFESPGLVPINVDDNSTVVIFEFYYGGGQTDLTFLEAATEILADASGTPVPISAFIGGTVTQAQGSESSIWNGTGAWATASNWSNGIPGDSTNAVINTGATEITSGAICRNLTINSGAQLIIQPGNSLTVNGNFTNNSEIIINSDSLLQGSFIVKGIINQNGISRMALNIYNDINYSVSSPVSGETAEVLSGSGSVHFYNEAANTLESLPSSSNLENGYGYAFESSSETTIVFEGPFNSNPVSVDLGFTNQGNILNEGWNLVGNPFTCSLDADDFVTTENADKAIYVWDNNRFRVWNGTTGSIPYGIIPPFTGYFVKANASNAIITFTKESKLHDFSHFNSAYSTPSNVLKLEMWDFENNVNNTILDEVFVQVEPTSTSGYDGAFDALKLDNLYEYPQFFINDNENNKLAISAIPEATQVTLGINVFTDGVAYTIKDASTSFEKNAYLIDTEELSTTNLKELDYTFTVDFTGVYPDRFVLVLSNLGTDDLDEDTGLLVYSKQNQIWINSMKNYGRCNIRIFDLSGRIISQSEQILESGSSTRIQGIQGINIIRIETKTSVMNFKVFIRQ